MASASGRRDLADSWGAMNMGRTALAGIAGRTRRTLHVRRGTALLGVAALASVGLVAIGPSAQAVHEYQLQMDGNTVDNAAHARPLDWENFFEADATTGDIVDKGTISSPFLARGHTADYALPEYSTFATGSKDTLNIGKVGTKAAGWQCGKSNNLGAKVDLVNVYTVAYRNPGNNHLILYFGAEKSSNLGDNNIAIWFLQDSAVGCTATGGGNVDFTGHHVPGDVFLSAAFTNGGETATVEARTWLAGTENYGEGKISGATAGFLCGTSTGDQACAITNDAVNNPPDGAIDPPWNHPVKTPAAGTTDSLADQEFYEGGVDVTQLQIDAGGSGDPCITTFLANTRSSQSPTATLFDFAYGSFPVCKPATTLNVSRSPATIHSGDSVTWTAVEQNTGTSPINNVSVTDAASSGPCTPFAGVLQSGETHNIGDVNDNDILDPGANNLGESWTFTCTQTLTADKTINIYGSGTDTISGKTITGGPDSACTFSSATPPVVTFQATGYVCDPNERASASVDVIFPSTTLTFTAATISPASGIVHATDAVVYTFYEKNDGDVPLTSPSVTTDDANCATATYSSGDSGTTGTVGVLDVGEEWAFTCSTSYATAGAKTIVAIGHGLDPLGVDVTRYDVSGSPCTAGALDTAANPDRLCDLQERTTQGVSVVNPSTYLRETAQAVVTFTYYETNDGDSGITTPYVDSTCAGSSAHAAQVRNSADNSSTTKDERLYNVGDLDLDFVLDGTDTTSETWTFTCTKTVSITSGNTVTYTDSSTGHGTDAAGSTVDNSTDSDEADSSTVTVTNNVPN